MMQNIKILKNSKIIGFIFFIIIFTFCKPNNNVVAPKNSTTILFYEVIVNGTPSSYLKELITINERNDTVFKHHKVFSFKLYLQDEYKQTKEYETCILKKLNLCFIKKYNYEHKKKYSLYLIPHEGSCSYYAYFDKDFPTNMLEPTYEICYETKLDKLQIKNNYFKKVYSFKETHIELYPNKRFLLYYDANFNLLKEERIEFNIHKGIEDEYMKIRIDKDTFEKNTKNFKIDSK